MDLSGLILITGGSSGIGKQLATDLLRSGAQVIVIGNAPDHLAKALVDLSVISPRVSGIECDLGNRDSVLRMNEQVLDQYGCPDILINNAGFGTYRTFEASDLEEIERLVDVNLMAAVRCTKLFLTHMIRRRSGAIVNMASIAGRIILTPNGTYCAAKHAMVAWSEVLKYELSRFKIQVNAICPGRVETAFFGHETFKKRAPRAETRYTTTVEDVSRATLRAIARNRFLTYVPRTLGVLVWLSNALPFLVRPVYARFMLRRIESVYDCSPLDLQAANEKQNE